MKIKITLEQLKRILEKAELKLPLTFTVGIIRPEEISRLLKRK